MMAQKIIKLRLLLLLIAFITGSALWAQEAKLNHYTLGEGISLTGNSGYELNLRGYFQPSFEMKTYTDKAIPDAANRFRMRRMRLRLSGKDASQKIEYRFQADFSGTSEAGNEATTAGSLFDAWVAYRPHRRVRLTFGQRVTQTDNRELWMGSNSLMLVERSRVTSAFASIREFGFFADATLPIGGGRYLKPYFTLTNGDGRNAFTQDRGGLKIGGRLDFLPFGLFTNLGQFRGTDVMRELAPKLVLGATYSYNNGISSRRGREGGRFIYLNDVNSNGVIDNGEERLPDYTKFGADFMFKYRGWTILGEFVATSASVPEDINLRNDAYGPDTDVLTDRFRGREFIGATSFTNYTPQQYVRRQLMLGRGYNIQMGYYFKSRTSVDMRYTHIDADQHSFLNNETFYNRPNYYTLGITQHFTQGYGFKIAASITHVDAGSGSFAIPEVAGGNTRPMNGNEWIFRLMTTFSF
jgi:hypothetical protein